MIPLISMGTSGDEALLHRDIALAHMSVQRFYIWRDSQQDHAHDNTRVWYQNQKDEKAHFGSQLGGMREHKPASSCCQAVLSKFRCSNPS